MRTLGALLLAALAIVAGWAFLDRPVPAPEWTGKLDGVSYNPSGLEDGKDTGLATTEDRIRADLTQLSAITGRVRTYTVAHGLNLVPKIAAELGMKVSLGVWVDGNKETDEAEIALAIKTIKANRAAIDRVFVGNEAILRGDLTVEQLLAYVKRIKRAAGRRIKVGAAEPWHVWIAHPDLAKGVDFIAAHMLPYWEGIPLGESIQHIADKVGELQAAFPKKEIVIGEAGWPSEGRIRRGSVPSVANQAAFIRSFAADAETKNYDYYVIEAYDQPWKAEGEGAVGAYWGIFNASGTAKFSFIGAITALPNWPALALGSLAGLLVLGLGLLRATPDLAFGGKLFLASLAGGICSGTAGIVSGAALEYADAWTLGLFVFFAPLALLASGVIVTEGVEFAHSLWRALRRRTGAAAPALTACPRVSIHVPCYDEPPGMVVETLNALARLDYPDFEVVVLDNNTRDPAVWRPLEERCRELGPRFRFFHLEGVKGFKAGALNEALARTDPEAELIAVIDSDYQVEPFWLRETVGYFAKPETVLVQAPQDYRDAGESAFKSMCYQEYAGFFRIGMVERDEANAIIQHGTMTIVRRTALERAGGWAPWCITEDSELGLRLFEQGGEAVYVPRSMGRGLMPDTLAAYKTQRYRWAYGAVQILKRHARALFFGSTRLTAAQRYHFVAGWLPWLTDGLSLLFTLGALVWTVLMAVAPRQFDIPMMSLSFVALALFLGKTFKTLILYPFRVSPRLRDAFAASIAGLSLSHTVGKAVLTGMITAKKPFLRTPKCEGAARLRHVFAASSEELMFLLALVLAIVSTALQWGLDEPVAAVWMTVLAVQAMPFAATVTMAWLSASRAAIARALAKPTPLPVPRA